MVQGLASQKNIDPIIEVQGLRKSSSMYKLRLSNYNYKQVQMDMGHSTPKMLMEYYDEIPEEERKTFIRDVQHELYEPNLDKRLPTDQESSLYTMLCKMKLNSEFMETFCNMMKFFQPLE